MLEKSEREGKRWRANTGFGAGDVLNGAASSGPLE